MIEFYGSTNNTPFMMKILTRLQDYLWRVRTSPKDFNDRKTMERGREILACMKFSIHRWGVTQQRLNQSSMRQ